MRNRKIVLNDTMPTLFVDGMMISTRTDGLHLIRLLTSLPKSIREQVRFIIPDEELKLIVDAICRYLNYTPRVKP